MDDALFEQHDWHRGTPNLLRRMGRVLLRDAVVFLLIVVVGEWGVRTFLPWCSRFVFTPTLTGGHPKTTNRYGLRDYEFPEKPSPDEIRILCLGNSTTYGAGVALDETYPKQLERLLNEDASGRFYRVINAGGEGRSTRDAVEFMRKKGLSFEPDAVVFGFSPSMLGVIVREQAKEVEQRVRPAARPSMTRRWIRTVREEARRIHRGLRQSYLYSAADMGMRYVLYRLDIIRASPTARAGAVFSYAFDVPGVDLEEVEAAYTLFAEDLAHLNDLLREHGIPLVVLGIPSRFMLSDDPADNVRRVPTDRIRIHPIDRVERYCRTLNIPFVNLRTRLRRERQAMHEGRRPWDELYTALDHTHLNPTGLHIAAEELYDELRRREWLALKGRPPKTITP